MNQIESLARDLAKMFGGSWWKRRKMKAQLNRFMRAGQASADAFWAAFGIVTPKTATTELEWWLMLRAQILKLLGRFPDGREH